MSTLYLIRHGSTEANLRHLYCGSTDLPLSDEGAEALRQLHYDIPDAKYLTSGMLRTEQTLEILFGNVPHSIDTRFREIDFGVFEMHSYQELKDDPAYQTWITGDNHRNVPPGGESGEAMTRRVLAGWQELTGQEGTTVLITHGGVIAAVMEHTFPEEHKNRYEWQPKPGHGYIIQAGSWQVLPTK